jgi:CPA1 family monovalent cation:H+ antiporter
VPHSEAIFIVLFIVAAVVAIAARRMRVPYTVALVLAGVLLGSLRLFEAPHLTRELLFSLILPGLLFEAAFHIELEDFYRDWMLVLALAVPGVVGTIGLTTILLTPVVTALAPVADFRWQHALVFGAVIAATDPIAVVALFKSLGAPRRLGLLVEAESLLNDGTSIVFFTLVLGVVAGRAGPVGTVAVEFAIVVGAGLLVGAGVGVVVSRVIKSIDDPMIEITLTTIAAYGAFAAAERLQYSGVIATVVAGMLCGNYGARGAMSATTRVAVQTFWDYVAFALNSIVFLLIGFEVHVADLLAAWIPIVLAFSAVTLGRAIVVFGAAGVFRLTRRSLPGSWSVVLAWGGVRGALSMVLVLGLPGAFPHRDLLVATTFGVVLLSILCQGLTMAPLLRWLGLVGTSPERRTYDRQRIVLQSAEAALAEVDRMARAHGASPEALETVRREYRERIEHAEAALRALHPRSEELRADELRRARRHLLLVEKERLIDAARRGALDPGIQEELLADVDTRLLRLDQGDSRPEPDPVA